MKAAIYSRLSQQDRDAGDNIKQQVQQCLEYAEQHELSVAKKHIYQDDGVSGALISRPALNEAIADAERGEFEVLVVRSHTRFSREATASGLLQEQFAMAGVTLHYVNLGGPVDRTTSAGIWTDGVMKIKAEAEKADIKERTARGRDRAFEAGHVMVGGTTILGYKRRRIMEGNVKEHYTVLEVDPAEAREVKRIFKNFLAGKTYGELAYDLNERKVPRQLPGPWKGEHIKRILLHPDYAGTRYYHVYTSEQIRIGYDDKRIRRRRKHDHPEVKSQPVQAIVDKKLWRKAQVKVESLNRQFARRAPDTMYLFRSRISCAKCGGSYNSKTYKKKNGRHWRYYRHNDVERHAGCENKGVNLTRDVLERRVMDLINDALSTPRKEWERLAEEATNEWLENTAENRAEVEGIDKELAQLEQDHTKARRLMLDDVFTAEDYAAESDRIGARVLALEQDRERLHSAGPTEQEIGYYFEGRMADLWEANTTAIEDRDQQEWFEMVDRLDLRLVVLEGAKSELRAKVEVHSPVLPLQVLNGGNGAEVD